MRRARWWRESVLSVGAVLGAICIIVAIAALVFDTRALIFRSGSMSPTIETGALAIATKVNAPDLAVGDIVSVLDDEDTRVTHRIVSLTVQGAAATLTLQGDDNTVADVQTYEVTTVERVLFSVPKLGYVVSWLSGPIGLILLGIYAAFLLSVLFGRRDRARPDSDGSRPDSVEPKPGSGETRRARNRALAIVLVVASATGSVAVAEPSWAVWTDTPASATSGAFQAHTVASQAQPACENVNGFLVLGNIARLTWAKNNAAYEYYWELRRADNNNLVTSGAIGAGAAEGAVMTLDISTGLIAINASYNVVVRARLSSSPGWAAATTTVTPVRLASILIIGVSFRCGHQ